MVVEIVRRRISLKVLCFTSSPRYLLLLSSNPGTILNDLLNYGLGCSRLIRTVLNSSTLLSSL